MLNEENLKNLQIFMTRVDLKGNESIPHADCLIKIGQMLARLQNPPPPKEDPPKDPPIDEDPPEIGKGKK